MDRNGHQGIEETTGQRSCSFLTSGDARGRSGVRVSAPPPTGPGHRAGPLPCPSVVSEASVHTGCTSHARGVRGHRGMAGPRRPGRPARADRPGARRRPGRPPPGHRHHPATYLAMVRRWELRAAGSSRRPRPPTAGATHDHQASGGSPPPAACLVGSGCSPAPGDRYLRATWTTAGSRVGDDQQDDHPVQNEAEHSDPVLRMALLDSRIALQRGQHAQQDR
jgi:hypothetical protein